MRGFSPSPVNGLSFERLPFGIVSMSIMGVRIVPQTHSGQNVAIGEPLQSQTKRKIVLLCDVLEPGMRDFSESTVNGLYIDSFSCDLDPMSIMGVRIVPHIQRL